MTDVAKMTPEQEDAFVRRVLEKRAAARTAEVKAANAEHLAKLEPAIPSLVEGKAVKLPELIEMLAALAGDRDPATAAHAQAAKNGLERLSDHLGRRVDALRAEVVVAPTADLLQA